jgi:aspartate dehydrogenase
LDGIATAARDPDMQLHLTLCRPGIHSEPGQLFAGSVRDGARRFPNETNVAVAAAIAGHGLDRSRIEIISVASPGRHSLTAVADSRYGRFTTEVALLPQGVMPGHPVAASVIAALERETRTVWAG